MDEDLSWHDLYLHDDFLGWAREDPAPRDKASTAMWNRYASANSTTLVQEL